MTARGKWLRVGTVWVGAAVLFGLQFRGIVFHFWVQMALGIAALCALSYLLDPSVLTEAFRGRFRGAARMAAAGVAAAALLYGIFYIGNAAARWLLPGAGGQISQVYGLKAGADRWLIGVLLLAVIGPGEEILWRAYIQRRLTGLLGRWGVPVAVAAYGAVHLASGNPLLIGAALVCGVYWALLYRWFDSLWLNGVSHALWDIAIFLIWPLSGG